MVEAAVFFGRGRRVGGDKNLAMIFVIERGGFNFRLHVQGADTFLEIIHPGRGGEGCAGKESGRILVKDGFLEIRSNVDGGGVYGNDLTTASGLF